MCERLQHLRLLETMMWQTEALATFGQPLLFKNTFLYFDLNTAQNAAPCKRSFSSPPKMRCVALSCTAPPPSTEVKLVKLATRTEIEEAALAEGRKQTLAELWYCLCEKITTQRASKLMAQVAEKRSGFSDIHKNTQSLYNPFWT